MINRISEKRIVRLRERRDLKEKAAEWFSSKWDIPKEAYLESIEKSFSAVVPSWYLCLVDDIIIAGMGVIENDFHNRPDLLLTGHTGLYERFGWEYLCPVQGDGEEKMSRMYVHRS